MSQTNAVAVGAIVSEYITSPLWGAAVDRKGPRVVSLAAAILFAGGYGLMAHAFPEGQGGHDVAALKGPWEMLPSYMTPPDWILLTSFYVLAGTATSASYFSAVSTAAKSFPRHSGLAIAVPCALFGLSPLLLSWVADGAFIDATTGELEVCRFLKFLAIGLCVVNSCGAAGLRVFPPLPAFEKLPPQTRTDATEQTETSALLPAIAQPNDMQSLATLLSDSGFWMLGVILLLITGPSEMVQAALGSIIEALILSPTIAPAPRSPPMPLPSALRMRARHVQVISVCNTSARIAGGALSDWLAPTPGRRSSAVAVSRLALLAVACFFYAMAYLYVAVGLKDTEGSGLWVLSISTGAAYGLIFTLIPSVVAIVWPLRQFGRNYGCMAYFSAIGALVFATLYGVIADSHATHPRGVCVGAQCFSATFYVCAVGAVIACILTVFLKKHRHSWKAKV